MIYLRGGRLHSTDWLEDQHIELIHLGADAGKGLSSWKPVSEEVVVEGLRLLLNPQVSCDRGG